MAAVIEVPYFPLRLLHHPADLLAAVRLEVHNLDLRLALD
jgi:hypothetical protein